MLRACALVLLCGVPVASPAFVSPAVACTWLLPCDTPGSGAVGRGLQPEDAVVVFARSCGSVCNKPPTHSEGSQPNARSHRAAARRNQGAAPMAHVAPVCATFAVGAARRTASLVVCTPRCGSSSCDTARSPVRVVARCSSAWLSVDSARTGDPVFFSQPGPPLKCHFSMSPPALTDLGEARRCAARRTRQTFDRTD